MTNISNSTKMSEVTGVLANLTGDRVNVQEIVDTISQISNFQEKTLSRIQSSLDYDGTDGAYLSGVYADMNYQRKIRLRKLINKLIELGEFNDDVAGSMDIAERPGGDYFVWDGLRRMIMAGLAGKKRVRVNKTVHKGDKTIQECRQHEAFLLEVRNTKLEGMKPEEIFKAQVCRKLPRALALLNLLENCNLDVEGILNKGTLLGGFAELDSNFQQGHDIKDKYFIASSNIIHATFPNSPQISVFLFVGLAYLLQYMDENADVIDESYDIAEVRERMIEYADTVLGRNKKGVDIKPKQSDLIMPRINGKTAQSVAWIITTNVLHDTDGLRTFLTDELDDQRGILVNGEYDE